MNRIFLFCFFLYLAASLSAQTLENGALKVAFHPETGAFDVLEKASGREWKSMPDEGVKLQEIADVQALEDEKAPKIRFGFVYPGLEKRLSAELTLEGNELAVKISGDPEMNQTGIRVEYPFPFEAQPGERVLLPHGCGFAFPVEMTNEDLETDRIDFMNFYTRDLNMGVWGQYAERAAESGEILPAAGYMAIVETPENASFRFSTRSNGLRQASICWNPDKMKLGHARSLRFVFMNECGPMLIAKRYRTAMDAKGFRVTFDQKRRRNPAMASRYDVLIGAPNIWYWGAEKVQVAKRLKELGFENFLMNCAGGAEAFWGLRSSTEEVLELAKIPNILVSCYDIYKDLVEPERRADLRYVSSDWIPEAWTNDDITRGPDGKPSRGWTVFPKDPSKPMIACASLCEKQAVHYARERIGRILETDPYSARFLDVTSTGLGECWNPKHPLNRRESLKARQDLYFLLGREFNLIAGGEDGIECFVPCCDYFEGCFSAPNHFRVDGGRYMWKIYDEVPEKIRLGTDETLRVPFWEMVFHDCVVSYWYWCDYNNKFPRIWWKRDLFNAVSATPPMYLFTKEVFEEIQPQLARSVKIAAAPARLTGGATMENFRFLTSDRKVQQSEFSNGVRVTVNFGEEPFRMSDGFVLEGRKSRVEK